MRNWNRPREDSSAALPRRRFLVYAGCSAACSALPATGCGSHDVDRLAEDVEVDLADHPELEELDQTVMLELDQLDLPLAITRIDPEGDAPFVITGTECNHRGCGVQRSGDGFRCPCHGARFDLDGSLDKGPATEDLVMYDYEVEDGVLTIFGQG